MSGGVEIEVPPPGATPHLVHYASAGFWFGEWAFIVGVRRYASVFAARPTMLGLLPAADCRAILKADPSAWQWIALLSAMTTELSVGVVTDSLLADPASGWPPCFCVCPACGALLSPPASRRRST